MAVDNRRANHRRNYVGGLGRPTRKRKEAQRKSSQIGVKMKIHGHEHLEIFGCKCERGTESAVADSVQRRVSRLHRKYQKLCLLTDEACNQMQDAQMAFKDLEAQRNEAWEEYNNARKQEPAND